MVIQNILRDIEDHDIGAAVSHFLNCFFGNVAAGKASTNNLHAKNQKKVCVHHQSLSFYSSFFVLELCYYTSLKQSKN